MTRLASVLLECDEPGCANVIDVFDDGEAIDEGWSLNPEFCPAHAAPDDAP